MDIAPCSADGAESSGETAGAAAGAYGPEPPAGPSLFDRVVAPYRAVASFLGKRALARAALAVPRTLRFMGTTAIRGEVSDGVAAPDLSLGFAAGVAIDEALLAVAMTPNRLPRPGDFDRVGAELAEARRHFSRRGWLARPASYHRRPPPLPTSAIERSNGWAMGLGYQRLTWESGFDVRPGEPGGERWMAYGPNAHATAAIVRHQGEQRPWVVCVHGFCMGYPFMDIVGLHVAKLHHELGLNVALPVLPLHGPRKVTLVSGEPFLSFDLMNTVHGLSQAVWDLRRLIGWIRAQGATSIALYGVSLGAYVISLLAGLEDEKFDAIVAGIPVADLPTLFHEHSPVHIRARSIEHRILGGVAEDVYRVVSPLSFEPNVAPDNRFIYAGYGDRLAFPEQARLLWEHWGRPEINWYAGNHVGYLWSGQVAGFLRDSLASAGLRVPVAAVRA